MYPFAVCYSVSGYLPTVRMSKPMTLADLLKEKLPAKERPPGITVKNRFDVLRTVRDRSASAASSRCDSPGKRVRTDSPDGPPPPDRNLAFTSMANEEEKFVKAKAIISKIKDGLSNAKDQGMQGLSGTSSTAWRSGWRSPLVCRR